MHTHKNNSVLLTLYASLKLSSPKLLLLITKYWKFLGLLKLIRFMDLMRYQILKLRSRFIITPLSTLFQNCINTRSFPDIWKESNIVFIHKKGIKKIVDNYRSVSLLHILGKNFWKSYFQCNFRVSWREWFTLPWAVWVHIFWIW